MTYTIAQVAEHLGVHPDSVRDLVRSGELAAFNASVNPNGSKPRYRITSEALAGFEARRSVVKPKARSPRRASTAFRRFV